MSESELGDGLISRRSVGQVEPVTDGVAQLHGFCNVGFVYGGGAALTVDTSNPRAGQRVAVALRETTRDPLAYIVYTHGHVDHVGGAAALLESEQEQGLPRPAIWGHENVPKRLERYRRTWGWNNEVNRRQFQLPEGTNAFPDDFVNPDETYRESVQLELAGEPVELHHASAETDDATWVWLPQRATALVGDLSVSSIPNTGNPNKPQRYTLGWAEALEAIAARKPEHIVPGHGEPIHGEERIAEVLSETARGLRFLHDAVLERMNSGQWPDEIVDADIRLPDDLAQKPYLQPIYGCVPFVIRDVLRQYAGWWGGNPAELIPARRSDVARDLIETAGRSVLIEKVRALAEKREHRRALHLAVLLAQADPSDREGQELVADVCDALVESEPSFIARNFYRVAAARARTASQE